MTPIIQPIPEIIAKTMQTKGSWRQDCPIAIEELAFLELSYLGFNKQIKTGQIICHNKIASSTAKIFEELLILGFPIEKMRLIDDYNGDDDLSMKDNNTSCFNFRTIGGTDILSMHAYGLAIDVNPRQNPFLIINDIEGKINAHPAAGVEYLNRHNLRDGMIEPYVNIFKKHGFEWGGKWNSPIDYHHFEIPRNELNSYLS